MLPRNDSETEACLLQAKEEYFEVLYKRYKEAGRKDKAVIIVIAKDFPQFIPVADYMITSLRILNSERARHASTSIFSKTKRKE